MGVGCGGGPEFHYSNFSDLIFWTILLSSSELFVSRS